MKVGVVDIGTNSMRLLICDEDREFGRWVEVTGLGRGVDATGRLSDDAIARTVHALDFFGERMDAHDVDQRRAVATSATRDAANREEFLERAGFALGVRPDVIDGEEEGRLGYAGATSDLDPNPNYLISDIGGGSTEFVRDSGAVSVDIGSVRLSDRILHDRPATSDQMGAARHHVQSLFADLMRGGQLVGVAGTWTSLAAIVLDLDSYDRRRVHHARVSVGQIGDVTERLAHLTIEATAAIPSLHPARAPVILAGAVVARGVMEVAGAESVLVSEKDSLDGIAMELMRLP